MVFHTLNSLELECIFISAMLQLLLAHKGSWVTAIIVRTRVKLGQSRSLSSSLYPILSAA